MLAGDMEQNEIKPIGGWLCNPHSWLGNRPFMFSTIALLHSCSIPCQLLPSLLISTRPEAVCIRLYSHIVFSSIFSGVARKRCSEKDCHTKAWDIADHHEHRLDV